MFRVFNSGGRGLACKNRDLGHPGRPGRPTKTIQKRETANIGNLPFPLSEQKMNFRVSEVPKLVPGSAPTVLPELLRVRFGHPGTLVRFLNLVLGALMGSADHSGRQIRVRKIVFSVSITDFSMKKPRT